MQSIERIACGELRVLVDEDAESDICLAFIKILTV